jgi:CAAX protease family protein
VASNETGSGLVGPKYLVGSATSAFSIADLRVPVWTILATVGLAVLDIGLGVPPTLWAIHLVGPARAKAMPWIPIYASHVAMLLVALLLIAWLGKGRLREWGLQWPPRKSYLGDAISWAVFFGVLMTLVDYLPQILSHTAPKNLPLTPLNVTGWLTFELLFVGFSEEIPFRGLMQTFLMKKSSGRVRFLGYDMHVAGVILALLFALAHLTSFWTVPFWAALGQQIYAFALGILYAYWYEKSQSLAAAIVCHSFSDALEQSLMFVMVWLWH